LQDTPIRGTFSTMQRIAISGLFVVLLAGSAGIAGDTPTRKIRTATAAPQASTLVTLAKIREAWVQDLRTKQLEPILKFYAPDAVFLQPTGERITGSAALHTLFQTVMATFNSDLTLHSQNLETSGDLAYDSGDFQETLTSIATGAKITAKGSYIIIFKHQPNGSWQIVQHAWTGTPPPGT
jgi:ketosteroid isomerase-like protein